MQNLGYYLKFDSDSLIETMDEMVQKYMRRHDQIFETFEAAENYFNELNKYSKERLKASIHVIQIDSKGLKLE